MIFEGKHFNKDESTGCWNWIRCIHHSGYGIVRRNYKNIIASRYSFTLFRGEIPTGEVVCHTCDNRKCVNPQHLWVGTVLDNVRDCRNKGRARYLRGSSHHNYKLNEEQIKEIKKLFSTGNFTKVGLAKLYNVSAALIYSIIKRNYRG